MRPGNGLPMTGIERQRLLAAAQAASASGDHETARRIFALFKIDYIARPGQETTIQRQPRRSK